MVKRKARHRYVYIVEYLKGSQRLGVSINAFLCEEDAREHGLQLIRANKGRAYMESRGRVRAATAFMVHKLPLHSVK